MTLFYLSIFAVLGTLLRYFLGNTLIVNIIGSFLIGLVYILAVEKNILPENLKIAIMVGFLGGFTTFSAYSLETLLQLQRGQVTAGLLYFIGSPVICLLCTFLGAQVGKQF
jgi:CrcB protein